MGPELLRVGGSWTPAAADLAHAARALQLRSRREVAGALAGGYRSAFRGGGIEFEGSRPYAPGDDVRAIDWNALARTGHTYVKHYREERDQTLLLLVDVSASMAFGSAGPAKGALAARSAALLAAATAYAGDRVALWTTLHDKHVNDKKYDCSWCHAFSRPERGLRMPKEKSPLVSTCKGGAHQPPLSHLDMHKLNPYRIIGGNQFRQFSRADHSHGHRSRAARIPIIGQGFAPRYN